MKWPEKELLSYYFLDGPIDMAALLKKPAWSPHIGSGDVTRSFTATLLRDCDDYCVTPPRQYYSIAEVSKLLT